MTATGPIAVAVTMRLAPAVAYDEPRDALSHDLSRLLRWSGSTSGLKRLRQALRRALPPEYRQTG